MTRLYRFASVDEGNDSDKSELACTPLGSDEDRSSQLTKAASTSQSSYIHELLNMFGLEDSYPDTSVPRKDAAQYAHLLQVTINAFDAALDGSSFASPITNHRRQLLQDYRDNIHHRCEVVKDCSVVPFEYLHGIEAQSHFLDVDNELTGTFHDDFEHKHSAAGISAEQPVVEKKDIGSNNTSLIAAETAQEEKPSHKQLSKSHFMSLSLEEKTRVLLPLLQKLKPANEDLPAKSSVRQKAYNYDQPHSKNSSTESSPTLGSYSPTVDQVDTVWNRVYGNPLELLSLEQVRDQTSFQRYIDRLEEPPVSVRQTTLPQVVDPLITATDEPFNHLGSTNTAQKENPTFSPTKNWQELQSAMNGLRRSLAAYPSGCPSSHQRAFAHYNSLLSTFDKTKPVVSEQSHETIPMSHDNAIPVATDNGCYWTEKQDRDLLYIRTTNPRWSWHSIAEEVGMTGAQCMKRFQVIRPKVSTSKVTSEKTENPEPKMNEAEKTSEKTAKRVEDAQQNLKVQLQSGINTGQSMMTHEPFPTEDDEAVCGLGSLEDEDAGFPPIWATAEQSEESEASYNWTEKADQKLVRLRRSKPKYSWPKIAKKLNAPIDLCKERFQLIKPRGSANKASKEGQNATKVKKASKARWYDMSSDDSRSVDAWSSHGSGSIYNPALEKDGNSTRKKKTERAAVAHTPYKITYWATVECGDQIVHIPVDSSNVAGPEKVILNGPAKKVWKWVQEKGLGDKIGLQDAFDLAKDIHGVDAVEEQKDYSDTPRSRASSSCRSYQDGKLRASLSSGVWNNTSICIACERDDDKCGCSLGRNRFSKDKDGYYWDA